MFCVECGCKLDVDCKFCPNCGTRVVKVEKSKETAQEQEQEKVSPCNEQAELDKLIDEIFWKLPGNPGDNGRALTHATGIPFRETYKIMKQKWKEFKEDRKKGKYPDTDYCPGCGSQNIGAYVRKSYTHTRKVEFFGEHYVTETVPEFVSKSDLQCNVCGYVWRPKSKKK